MATLLGGLTPASYSDGCGGAQPGRQLARSVASHRFFVCEFEPGTVRGETALATWPGAKPDAEASTVALFDLFLALLGLERMCGCYQSSRIESA